MPQRRRRRTWKGDRELVGARVHPERKNAVREAVATFRITENDWFGAAIHLALKHPECVEPVSVALPQHPPVVQARVHPSTKAEVDDAAADAGLSRDRWLAWAIEFAVLHPMLLAPVIEKLRAQPPQHVSNNREALGQSA